MIPETTPSEVNVGLPFQVEKLCAVLGGIDESEVGIFRVAAGGEGEGELAPAGELLGVGHQLLPVVGGVQPAAANIALL